MALTDTPQDRHPAASFRLVCLFVSGDHFISACTFHLWIFEIRSCGRIGWLLHSSPGPKRLATLSTQPNKKMAITWINVNKYRKRGWRTSTRHRWSESWQILGAFAGNLVTYLAPVSDAAIETSKWTRQLATEREKEREKEHTARRFERYTFINLISEATVVPSPRLRQWQRRHRRQLRRQLRR